MGEGIDLDYVNHWLSEILGADDSRIERLRETVETAAKLMAEQPTCKSG